MTVEKKKEKKRNIGKGDEERRWKIQKGLKITRLLQITVLM